MSRAKAKLAILHDMQNRQSDLILQKKDCDMIAAALLECYEYKRIESLYRWMKNLSRIR